MKLLIASDTHLESRTSGSILPLIPESAFYMNSIDVIVLAGDINSAINLGTTIDQMAETFPGVPIVYTTGNHEYYSRTFLMPEINAMIKDIENDIPEFHYLQNESIEINGVRFYGGTMWSGLECQYPTFPINDHDMIRLARSKHINIDDIRSMFNNFCEGLEKFIESGDMKKSIVVSHFSPSLDFNNPFVKCKTTDDLAMAKYFSANMDHIIDDPEKCPFMWVYGHNHFSMDETRKSGCRVLSNQIGYQHFENNNFQNKFRIFDIDI